MEWNARKIKEFQVDDVVAFESKVYKLMGYELNERFTTLDRVIYVVGELC